MVKNIKILFLLLGCMVVCNGYAQSIKGTIVDSNSQPLEFATIAICSVADTTTIIASGSTDISGSFNIRYDEHRLDSIIVKTYCLGYKNKQLRIGCSTSDLGTIKMEDESFMLDGVSVSAQRRPYSFQNGVLKVDLKYLSNTRSDKIVDVLKRIPGVVVTSSSIVVNGSSPAVVIDGIKQRMPITQLLTYLASVPAQQVENIAINTNQLAENKLGSEEVTIEIQTKKKSVEGYSFTNSTYGQLFQHDSYKYGNYTDMMIKYGSLAGNVSFGLNNRSLYTKEENIVNQDILESGSRQKKFAYFGVMNFTWNPEWINGALNVFASYYRDDAKNHRQEDYWQNSVQTKTVMRDNKDVPDMLSLNVEYDSNEKKNNQWKFAYGLLKGMQDFKENSSNNNGGNGSMNKYLDGHQHIFEGQYKYKVSKFEFKTGAQAYLTKIGQDYSENTYSPVRYDITENMTSLYASLQWKLMESMSLYLGTRWEHTDYKYVVGDLSESSKFDNLSPSLSFNWRVSDSYSTSLKFATDNIHPTFNNYMPGKNNISDDEYSEGNLNLVPARKFNLRWENLLFGYANLSASCLWVNDYMSSLYRMNNNMRYSTYVNFCNYFATNAYLSVPFSFVNGKLRGQLSASERYIKYSNIADGIQSDYIFNNIWYTAVDMYVGYEMSDRFSMFVNPYYTSPSKKLQKRSNSVFTMDFGMEYSFLKDKSLSLSLSCQDLFNNDYVDSKVFYDSQVVSYKAWPPSRTVMLTLSYSLSKNRKSIKIKRNENDVDRFATSGN